MVDAALEYAEHGAPVFPIWSTVGGRCQCGDSSCDNQGKHPLGRLAPNGFKDAITDAPTIRRWWRLYPTAHIGTATESWTVVLDVDPAKAGDETLKELELIHGPLPETAEVLTGGGGRHLYFEKAAVPVPCSTGKIGPGLDVRAVGGYTILPPSGHKSGGIYRDEIEHPLFETTLAPLPDWLLRLALTPTSSNGDGAHEGTDWAALLAGAPEGERHGIALKIAGHYLGKRCPPKEVETIMTPWVAACTPPYDFADVRRIIADLAAKDAARSAGRPGPRSSDPRTDDPGAVAQNAYLETIATFLLEEDPPVNAIFPDLLPCGVLMLLHGEPRARKSLAAFELALAAATGTAPFGLSRFRPPGPVGVTYIQEEDPRPLTRDRVRRLIQKRCGDVLPATLYVSVRRGVDLDDPAWVERIIRDLIDRDVRLLVLDAARRLSTKTDEGPAKVRELMAALRAIVTRAGVSVVIVHHDIKPPTTGQDLRRRGQRASGGDWFAACECPVHIERVDGHDSLVYPQDYKFSADPAPFTFSCQMDGRLISALVGRDTTTDHAETAGERGKVLEWLRLNGPAAKTAMKKAGFGWATITPLLDGLLRDGLVDETPGRTARSRLYFVIGEASSESQDSSPQGRLDVL
jgi:hypothetical protein